MCQIYWICALAPDDHRSAVITPDRRLRARLHPGPRSHLVIVLAATGQLGWPGECYCTDTPPSVMIVPVTADGNLVLVRRYLKARVLEFSVAFLGHQVVTGDPRVAGPYLQVRLFGMIEAVGPSAPDPDSGYTYRRLMTSATRAARLLAWGRTGEQQARAAALAGHRLGLTTNQPPADSYV